MDTKKIRLKLGMSQQAFGSEIGVSISAVQNWESGKNKPCKFSMEKIEFLIKKVNKRRSLNGVNRNN